jgi:NAD(P)-dependent dehydrogenase (short-subunit alcohol dehydrogenase family)
MSMRLQGKVAVVTGSSTGIGKACATLFAEEGACVVVNDEGIEQDLGPQVVEEIRAKGGTASYFCADVTKKEDIESLINYAILTYGRLDILMNNAVTGRSSALMDQEEEEWEKVYLSTVKAVYHSCKLAIPEMIKLGGGSIINVSSIHGMLGGRSGLAYSTFKGALLNMTRQIAVDYGCYNIRVNALCPGRIVTERKIGFLEQNPEEYRRQKAVYPLGRPGALHEIATAALFLASEESSFVTGHALAVDGGFTAQLQDSIITPLEKGISDELLERDIIWP